MSNLRNSVQLIGRLGKNPEVKQLDSGRFVANVSIATNDIYKNSKGEKVIETQWHHLVAWGKNAENFQKILAKGDEVAIQGKLTHRSYEKDGITRYVTEIVVNEFVKLSSRVGATPRLSNAQPV
ncbi:MAG TPA: single-stranded DNA-binding protein [Phaeodactylibacter sp.]|nr:single-stranded DNA-binding protein [Phaeodactylibacter sp.]